MDEQRRNNRVLVLKSASIRCAGDMPAIDCAVLNVSPSGACILIPTNVTVPEKFILFVDPHGIRRDCNVVWRKGARIGVEFAPSAHEEACQ
jgi:hypothetical protein